MEKQGGIVRGGEATSHDNNGVKYTVKSTGQLVELEGDEIVLCENALKSDHCHQITGTPLEILKKIADEYGCKRGTLDKIHGGEFVICKKVVRDTESITVEGTPAEIVSYLQVQKGCNPHWSWELDKEECPVCKLEAVELEKGGKIDFLKKSLFSDLPRNYQIGIVIRAYEVNEDVDWHYTDEPIDLDWINDKVFVDTLIGDYNKQYPNRYFSYGVIPTSVIIEKIKQTEFYEELGMDFDEYARNYNSTNYAKHQTADIPILISDDEPEFIEDGWHRFHRYLDMGLQEIPVVSYNPDIKLEKGGAVIQKKELKYKESLPTVTLIRGEGNNNTGNVDICGQGLYLTDDSDVAKYYGDKIVSYKVTGKIYDTTKDFSLQEIKAVCAEIDKNTGTGAGGQYIQDLTDYNEGKLPEKTDVDHRSLSQALSCNGRLYKWMKANGFCKSEFNPDANFCDIINQALVNLGYVGIRYSTNLVDDLEEKGLGGKNAFVIFDKGSAVKMEKGGSVLLAPNSELTSLTRKQYRLTQSPEFISFFGNWMTDPQNASKIVDRNGMPLVMYHGTKNRFSEFSKERQTKGWYSKGFYFSENKEDAKSYGEIVIPVFLSIKKPFVIQGDKVNADGSVSFAKTPKEQIIEAYPEAKNIAWGDVSGLLSSLGYDGIVAGDWVIAFDPAQIKLADGTNTTFNSTNPDIRYERGGGILLAPNGKPSKLTPEQYRLTRSPEFISFFGDFINDPQSASKVVDENGDPLPQFHFDRISFRVERNRLLTGMSTKRTPNFYEFNTKGKELGSHFGTKRQVEALLKAVDTDWGAAKDYIYEVFLNVTNPVRCVDYGYFMATSLADAIGEKYGAVVADKVEEVHDNSWHSRIADDKAEALAKEYGVDGIVYLNRFESVLFNEMGADFEHIDKYSDERLRKEYDVEDSWIVFEPNQIKLADGSNRTFDANSPDVRFAEGGDLLDSKNSNSFTWKINKKGIQDVISGKGKVGEGSLIQATKSYIRTGKTTGYGYKEGEPSKEQEGALLKQYIDENGLWVDISGLDSYLDEGAEQRVYLVDGQYVLKVNDGIFYASWEDYFNNLLLHNYFFPDTAYELIGFANEDHNIFAIVKQPFVLINEKTDLGLVKQALAENGFVNKKNNDYYNPDLGIILEDLHDENVLTRDGILYFIDTVFYLTDEAKEEIKKTELLGTIFQSIALEYSVSQNKSSGKPVNEKTIGLVVNGKPPLRATDGSDIKDRKIRELIQTFPENISKVEKGEEVAFDKSALESLNRDYALSQIFSSDDVSDNVFKILNSHVGRATEFDAHVVWLYLNSIARPYGETYLKTHCIENIEELDAYLKTLWSGAKKMEFGGEILQFYEPDTMIPTTNDFHNGELPHMSLPIFEKGGAIIPPTEEELEARWDKKKDHIMQLASSIRKLRYNVTLDMKSKDEKTKLTALVIALMDITSERIGNEESAGEGHHGISGLLKSHVKISGNRVSITYTGKSGVDQHKEFTDEYVALGLKWAIKKSPDEYVFTTSDGFKIKADRCNRYLSEYNCTAKDLRSFGGNKHIIERLKKAPEAEEQKDREKIFREAVKYAAEKVGNKAPTFKKHYLIPELEKEYILHGKIIDLSDFYKTGGLIKMAEGGQVYQGRSGAGVFIVARKTGRGLLLLRSDVVSEPQTWGFVSGEIDGNETPEQTVYREMFEEIGLKKKIPLLLMHKFEDKEKGFTFYNYIGLVEDEFEPKLDFENDDYNWFDFDALPEPLHFGVKETFDTTDVMSYAVDLYIDNEPKYALSPADSYIPKVFESYFRTQEGKVPVEKIDAMIESLSPARKELYEKVWSDFKSLHDVTVSGKDYVLEDWQSLSKPAEFAKGGSLEKLSYYNNCVGYDNLEELEYIIDHEREITYDSSQKHRKIFLCS